MESSFFAFVGTMWTILLLLASATFGACTKVDATLGEDVLLLCNCPRNKERYLVWQIGANTIVDQYIPGYEKSNISTQFLGRTRLFFSEDTGNCSLLLTSVTKADQDTYTCHYFSEKEYTSADVTLYVNEQGRQGQPTSSPSYEPEKNGVPYAIGGVLLIISLLSIVFLTVRYRQRHLRSNVEAPGLPDGEQLESLNP